MDWPQTQRTRQDVEDVLRAVPLVPGCAGGDRQRRVGVRLLLDWLSDQPGQTWQERWTSSGADQAGRAWRDVAETWLAGAGRGPWRRDALAQALPVAISADLIRPSLGWLAGGGGARGGLLARNIAATRDPDGFARMRALTDVDDGVSVPAATQVVYRATLILAAKGGTLAQITIGDVVELFEALGRGRLQPASGCGTLYRVLRQLGIFGGDAPARFNVLRTLGQRTPEELIDRYSLQCRPIRDLLVDYLRERQPALDYTSLDSLSTFLGLRFWADIEAHHPNLRTLRLPQDVADGWKTRLRTISKTTIDDTGRRTEVSIPRINYRECLTPVRALYLDLAHWAVEDPSRWAPWVAPCPVGEEEVNRRKAQRQRKSRMDARTRERLPALPTLVRSVHHRRTSCAELLQAAQLTDPGHEFTSDGGTWVRSLIGRGTADTIWADNAATGKRHNLSREEDHAFWAWAVVEVLRATGVRVEELCELTHHSLVQYRLPTTGELIPLLQIMPSKTDTERLLVVSPELAEVLSAIITRIRDGSGAVPLVAAYDGRERLWSAPAPLLFQRRIGTENRGMTSGAVGTLLAGALEWTALADAVTGEPLHYTPHDFRRMFITDAILNGLPPHIAQVIAGHQDINITLGYKAIYPDEAIQTHRAFLARRRSLRPSDEYRTPSDEEWQQFLGHFERRKVSTGTCARAFSTPCIHEHACVRCPMLWPDPDQRNRLVDIRDNLIERIAEARREDWPGEVEGLQVSLAGANDKIAQIDQRPAATTPVDLGLPGRG